MSPLSRRQIVVDTTNKLHVQLVDEETIAQEREKGKRRAPLFRCGGKNAAQKFLFALLKEMAFRAVILKNAVYADAASEKIKILERAQAEKDVRQSVRKAAARRVRRNCCGSHP